MSVAKDVKLMVAPQELAPLMAEFGKAYTRKLFTEMGRTGTTPARARLLMTLQCHGSCKMTDISGYMSVTPRSITKLVDSLELEGLVTREPHPQDRRATIIRLTAQGMIVCKESALANHAAVTSLYEHLDLKERQQLAQILRKLIGALNDEAQAEEG